MSDHIYKLIELTGSSTRSSDDAIQNAIKKASKSVKHMDWFEVTEIRGSIRDGGVQYWQVSLKIGFRLED